MYMCSFLVWKNACLNYREFDLEGALVGVPHTWYLTIQPFITLKKTCLKREEHGSYEWVEKEMGRFAEDMS